MTTIIGGTNPAVTFPDGTIQNTSAVVGSSVPYSVLPTGSVLQVVNATYSTQVNYASSTSTDTGLTATITPRFSTSKILIIIDQNGVSKDSNNTGVNLSLQRNGSNILANFGLVAGFTGGTVSNDIGTVGATYLDSPGTTSSVIYKTQFASNSNNANAIVQQFNCPSTITLMEIAG